MNRRIHFNKGTNDGLKKPEVLNLFASRWNVEKVTIRNSCTFVLFQTQVDCAEVVAVKHFFIKNVQFTVGYAKGSFHMDLLKDNALQTLLQNVPDSQGQPKKQIISRQGIQFGPTYQVGLPNNQNYQFAGRPTGQLAPQNKTLTVYAPAPRGQPMRAPDLLNKQQVLVTIHQNYQQPGNMFVPKFPATNFYIANFATNISTTNNQLVSATKQFSLPLQAQTNFGKLAVGYVGKCPLSWPY